MQRLPAVAGLFYPDAPDVLSDVVDTYMAAAEHSFSQLPTAIIAPHAGYVYSGPVAGSVYGACRTCSSGIRQVIVLSPSHRVAFSGCALTDADSFVTPLGSVPVDRSARARLADLSDVQVLEAAHADEHGIEVHLPFLQRLSDSFHLVPIVVGDAEGELVETILFRLWQRQESLIVVSSDLSHYLPYAAARQLDEQTAHAIEEGRPSDIERDQACGRIPMQGLLRMANRLGWTTTRLDLRNSGDSAGSKDQVVGYGAWALTEAAA